MALLRMADNDSNSFVFSQLAKLGPGLYSNY